MQFSKSTYISSERSRGIPVTLILGGGVLPTKITVTVIPSDQSPVSAKGKEHLSGPEPTVRPVRFWPDHFLLGARPL